MSADHVEEALKSIAYDLESLVFQMRQKGWATATAAFRLNSPGHPLIDINCDKHWFDKGLRPFHTLSFATGWHTAEAETWDAAYEDAQKAIAGMDENYGRMAAWQFYVASLDPGEREAFLRSVGVPPTAEAPA